jgi:hypothetical protein
VNLLNDAGTSFSLTTGSLNSGSYNPISVCSDIPEATPVNVYFLLANSRPGKLTVFDATNTEVVSSGWVGQAAYPGPWGSSVNTSELTSSIQFTNNILLAPYSLVAEYGNAPSLTQTMYVSLTCDTSITGSLTLSPLQLSVTSSCAFGGSNGFISASVIGGTAPYFYSNNSGSSYSSGTYDTSYVWSNLSDADYNVIVKDSSNNEQKVFWPTIYCLPRKINVDIVRWDPTATATITYSGTTYSSFFTASGYVSQSLAFTASATNSSTFEGWNSAPSRDNKLSTNVRYTYVVQNATSQSLYALVSKPGSPAAETFCYFVDNPIEKSECSDCTSPSTAYFNSSSYDTNYLTGSYWYQDTNLSIPVINGYYRQSTNGINPGANIIYALTNGTASAVGTCDGTEIITC